jgi:hypothetical protein
MNALLSLFSSRFAATGVRPFLIDGSTVSIRVSGRLHEVMG